MHLNKEVEMKKFIILMILATFLIGGTAQAKVEEMVKQVGDLQVKLSMEMAQHNESGHHSSTEGEHHNSMGGNNLGINIFDSEGNEVKDAKIKISYTMPPKDNMPPMKYTARAKLNGETYQSKLNFSMKGEWNIMVYIKRPGKDLAKVDFKMHVM
jgi:hypothetical protein